MPAVLFATALDDLFADASIARDGVYRAGGTGTGIPVRVVLRRPDRIGDFGDTRLLTETAVFDVRVSDVAAPAAGDPVEVDELVYVIRGEPVRDEERLVWTVEARPA